jgi:dihydrolipoamide dehydrogenase
MTQMQAWKSGIVKKLTGGVQSLVKGAGTTYVKATAEFLDAAPGQADVRDGKPDDIVEAEHIVIATGSLPIEIPGFKFDHKRVLDSTSALDLATMPEADGVHRRRDHRARARADVPAPRHPARSCSRGSQRILTGVDTECADVVARQIKKDGGQIHVGAKAIGWEERDGQAMVKAEVGGKVVEFACDVILVASGAPGDQGFGLEKTGVKVSQRGFIEVDNRLQTNVPGVYAVGDVVGQPMLAHKASHEGEVFAEVIAGKKTINDARQIPNVVFTEPEIASSGLTVEEAEAKGRKTNVGKFPFVVSGRAMAIGETQGFVKIVTDAEDDRVLGVHIVGPEASDLINEAALAIEMGAFAEDIALTIHPHPTLGEAVMEAAKHALGEAIHIGNTRRPAH